MRLSELLGLDVVDHAGTRVGTVVDLQLVQDGPLIGPYGASLRLGAIVAVERRHVRLLGFERDVGPWLIRTIVRRINGRVRHIPWESVDTILDGEIRLQLGYEY
jgi:PRC-barrel domain protein